MTRRLVLLHDDDDEEGAIGIVLDGPVRLDRWRQADDGTPVLIIVRDGRRTITLPPGTRIEFLQEAQV